ncbi:Reverse transcriptase [Pyrenophora teres f. teres]|uniref:Reverse transcriptase n=1 Tax=Pyrenophora teres f. teres TaxID=97479 RepID=A0A6S6W7F4_9PLEO|nr:Reverse transcriptase [Pyrenophora teres f. teres]
MELAAASCEPSDGPMQRTHYISAASLYGIPGVDKNSALVDTGASACFVNHEWIKQQKYTTFKVSKPIRLALADGEEVAKLTHAADITIKHGNHISTVLCYVTSLGKYDVILGMNWLDRHKPVLGFGSSRSMTFDHKDCKVNCLKDGIQDTVYEDRPPESASRKLSQESTPAGDLKISMISAEAACMAAAKEPETVVWLEPHHFDKIKQPKDPSHDDCDLSAFRDQVAGLASVTQEDFEHYMAKMERPPMSDEQIRKLLADVLSPRRPGVDHVIDIEPGTAVPKPHIYGLTREETMAVKAYIDEMIGKGFIRLSTSPYASPVLVVKKPSGGLRICVDYRGLNAVTRKNRNAPPAIKETLARMAKTFINETLRDHLDIICTAYLDDVLIYLDDEAKHEDHVLTVLGKISKAGMYLDAAKCSFSTKRVKYLGLILTTDGLEMDPKKVATVLEWQLPRTVKDVQAFLGFANFYRRFIKGFSTIARPLTELTRAEGKKSFPLSPDSKAVSAFNQLKRSFETAGMLAHFDSDLETWLETDASDFVTAAVLSQMHGNVLRPVAFVSHKMNPAECNYEIYDKELLAIVDPALRVATLTSHQGPDTKHAVFLACCHLQRARLTVLDVAQRMYSDSEMDLVLETCALDALHLAPVANEEPQGLGGENDVAPDDAGDLTDRISAAYPQDALLQAIIKAKKDGLRRLPANIVGSDRKLRLELGDCALYNDLLYVRGKLYVPDFSDVRTKVLNQVHRSLCGGGHGGKHETYAKLTRWYFWPRMTYDVA